MLMNPALQKLFGYIDFFGGVVLIETVLTTENVTLTKYK